MFYMDPVLLEIWSVLTGCIFLNMPDTNIREQILDHSSDKKADVQKEKKMVTKNSELLC